MSHSPKKRIIVFRRAKNHTPFYMTKSAYASVFISMFKVEILVWCNEPIQVEL